MIKLIAETAWHHEGDFTFMKNLISEIINKTKTDIIKMHVTLDLDEYMDSNHELFEKLKSMLFSKEQWQELISMVKESDKDLMLLTNDTTAIKYASIFKPEYIELHSTCLNVPTLQNTVLDKLSENTKIVIGVGGSTLKEIDRAIKTFENRKIILMFGFQNYPTKYEDVNILKMRKIQSLYPNKIFGYADHTAWNEANNELITLLGAANGMSFVEKHVTNIFGQERIDFSAAISIEMFNSLNDKLKLLSQIHGDGLLKLNDGEKSYSIYGPMKLAPIARFEMKEGHIISLEDILFKRTKEKTDLSQVDIMNLMGKTLIKSISTNEILNSSYFDTI